ncbi:hypothetical protein ACFLWG_00195 [Chloroflexota bacterium]
MKIEITTLSENTADSRALAEMSFEQIKEVIIVSKIPIKSGSLVGEEEYNCFPIIRVHSTSALCI